MGIHFSVAQSSFYELFSNNFSLFHLQQGPQNGAAAAVVRGGGRSGADQDAQPPALRVESSARELLQVEHLESDPWSGSLNLTGCNRQLHAPPQPHHATGLLAATDTIYNPQYKENASAL